jgi:hypothetical protein
MGLTALTAGLVAVDRGFASRLAMERVDLLTIKELGGWRSLAMVQRYAHLSPSHRRSAIERLVSRQVTVEKSEAAAP